jgi:hypothetical protein
VRLPRDITPAAAARRRLLGDLAAAAFIATVTIALCAGIGIVGILALTTILLISISIAVEAFARRLRRRRALGRRYKAAA